ncbi:MAG TPA: Xaa-Pro peptidase family protein [Candidatus Dormibacteraeota bacterium]|nr:Xaa-Pro peptidase family protein [Candidatus Dormibacteraeota bacterium]
MFSRLRVPVLAAVLAMALPSMLAAEDPIPPAKPFAPEVYSARRAKLMKALGGGIAVLYARGEEDADGYRQDSDFYYLTGLDEPGAVLVLAPEERLYKERLFLKPRNPDDERWTGVRPDIGDSLRHATGIDRISRVGSLGGAMMSLLQTSTTLQMINDPGGPDAPTTPEMELYGKLSSRLPGVSIKNRTDLLPAMRSVKEPRELDSMERAIAATVAAQHAAARAIHPGVEENWVAGLIDLEFKRGGAVRPGFPPIVGSGANSTILHYPEHSRTIAPGSLVVVDIGSDYGHYSADITRTYPADGHFTPEQRKVYEVVLRAQQECMEMIRPGVYYEDLHKKAEDVIRAAGYRDYFIHGLGHFVGLDVHDAGLYKKPLQAGMVITVEPGIYIPEKSLGIRIEDQVLVTPKGYRHLTQALPRDPDAVERMMRGE